MDRVWVNSLGINKCMLTFGVNPSFASITIRQRLFWWRTFKILSVLDDNGAVEETLLIGSTWSGPFRSNFLCSLSSVRPLIFWCTNIFLRSTVWHSHSYFAEFEFRCYRDLGKPGSMGLSDLLRSQTVALSLTTQFLSQHQPLVLLNMKIYFSLFLIGFLLIDLWKIIKWKITDVQERLNLCFFWKNLGL